LKLGVFLFRLITSDSLGFRFSEKVWAGILKQGVSPRLRFYSLIPLPDCIQDF